MESVLIFLRFHWFNHELARNTVLVLMFILTAVVIYITVIDPALAGAVGGELLRGAAGSHLKP